MLYDIINVRGSTLTPKDGLGLASRALGRSEASAFEKFFTILRRILTHQWGLLLLRRVVVRIPTCNENLLTLYETLIKKLIRALPLLPIFITSAASVGQKYIVPSLLALIRSTNNIPLRDGLQIVM